MRVGFRTSQAEFGEGVGKARILKGEIFLTSKLWNSKHVGGDVESALDGALNNLGMNYIPVSENRL